MDAKQEIASRYSAIREQLDPTDGPIIEAVTRLVHHGEIKLALRLMRSLELATTLGMPKYNTANYTPDYDWLESTDADTIRRMLADILYELSDRPLAPEQRAVLSQAVYFGTQDDWAKYGYLLAHGLRASVLHGGPRPHPVADVTNFPESKLAAMAQKLEAQANGAKAAHWFGDYLKNVFPAFLGVWMVNRGMDRLNHGGH